MKTSEDWKNEFLNIAPRWMGGTVGEWLFHGLGAALVLVQNWWNSWENIIKREKATGDILDALASEIGIIRKPGEDDESLRHRLLSIDNGCTPSFIIKSCESITNAGVEYIEPARFLSDLNCFADYTRLIPSQTDGGALRNVIFLFFAAVTKETIENVSKGITTGESLRPACTYFYYLLENNLDFNQGLSLDLFNGGNYV